MYRFTLVLPANFLFSLPVFAQQSPNSTAQKPIGFAAVPAEAAKKENPVKPSPESLARAKKWWTLDCAMCHGGNGDGKGETAKDMKLSMMDMTDPATLKDHTDGEIC